MIACSFAELVADLRLRRQQTRLAGERPPVLLLGAGASVESGIGAMTELFAFVGQQDFAGFCDYIRPRTEDERYRLLARFLQTQEPAAVTPGYQALAALCAEAFFDLVLTTNLDPLLDDALAAARLWRRDYLLLVNGVVRPERMEQLLRAPAPRVKVIKLHGDLFHRYMAWTPAEMESWVDDIKPQLDASLRGRDVLVVGHSLRDVRIREVVLGTGGALWYATPFQVPQFLAGNDLVRAVTGAEAAFERLFTGLARDLAVPVPTAPKAPAAPAAAAPAAGPALPEAGLADAPKGRRGARAVDLESASAPRPRRGARAGKAPPAAAVPAVARTVDDLLAATVGIVGDRGHHIMTGFLLAQPRVIVTDGYLGNVLPDVRRLKVVTADGRQWRVDVLHRAGGHPFGPVLLAAPDALQVAGLAVARGAARAGSRVRIVVAAGERPGLSTGMVRTGKVRTVDIQPIGPVRGMVELDAVVAPGASGAPVVDDELGLRGFVVAGSTDRPPALMFPVTAWRKHLSAAAQRG